jgi:hypothetical protein
MLRESGRIRLADAMTALALLGPVLAAARANVPLGVGVAAILGMAAHRVRAVLRAEREAGWPVGFGRLAAAWAESACCAILLAFLTALAGALTFWVAASAVAGITMGLGGSPSAALAIRAGLLVALGLTAAAMSRTASMLRRNFWPAPDGGEPDA